MRQLRRVADIKERRLRGNMPDPHLCNHEAEIAIMGETLRRHHDTLAAHSELLAAQHTSNVVNAEAVESIRLTLSSLANEVKGLVIQVSEWTGSLKILVWIVGMFGSAIVGLIAVFFSYLLSKGF